MFSLATILEMNARIERKKAYDRQYHAERRAASKATIDKSWENCAKPFYVINGVITDINPADI